MNDWKEQPNQSEWKFSQPIEKPSVKFAPTQIQSEAANTIGLVICHMGSKKQLIVQEILEEIGYKTQKWRGDYKLTKEQVESIKKSLESIAIVISQIKN